ncbi:hypothetical protein [Bdellovibrio reynosensis]|uniref:Lipoprotein n=1 Tax=Bdellovibrio reynosensis TaxID=2835041 RepID=A0ABY4CAN3_9BACT|nr:hypothetical protein [Bdellovibrio reynosensis]UOF00568.1 hypothetical protein MNR06_12750 [Bdellovibrio reynosensis]
MNSKIYLAVAILSLGPVLGCAPDSSGENNKIKDEVTGWPEPGTPSPTAEYIEAECKKAFTQEQINAFMASNRTNSIGGIRGEGKIACYKSKVENGRTSKVEFNGFTTASIIRKEIAKSVDFDGTEIKIRTESLDVSAEDLATFEESFGKPIRLYPSSISKAELGFLGEVPVYNISEYPGSDGGRLYSIKFTKMENELAKKAVQDFRNGEALVIASQNFQKDIETMTAFYGREMVPGKADVVAFLNDLWESSESADLSASEKTNLKFKWMKTSLKWANHIQPSVKLGQPSWDRALKVAKDLWSPRSSKLETADADSSLMALEFLTALDPSSSAMKYRTYAIKLNAYITGDSRYLLNETLRLAEKPYSVSHEEILFATAKELNDWKINVEICTATQFDETKIDLIIDLSKWLVSAGHYSGSSAYKAKELVLENNFNSERIAELKVAYAWISKDSSYRALDKAEELVKTMTSQQLKDLKETFQWVAQDSSYRAYEKAVDLVRTMTSQQLKNLKETYVWVRQDSTYRAYEKSVELVQTMTSQQLNDLKETYAWVRQDSTYRAYERSVQLVQTRSSQQLKDLKETYEWVKQEGSYRAYEKSIDLLNTLSSEQLKVLKEAYLWIKTFEYRAYDKANSYVVEKGMTADKLQALKNSFAKHRKKLSASSALSEAEKEVFGN